MQAIEGGMTVNALRKLACGGVAILAAGVVHAQLPDVPQGTVSVEVQPVAIGLSSPVELVPANDGSGRLFIVEQPGRVRSLNTGTINPQVFLDMSGQILFGGEQGLLGLAFHPDFGDPSKPGYQTLYTYATHPPDATPDFSVPMSGTPANHCVLTEWKTSGTAGGGVNPATRREVLRIAHPQSNHNGGKISFRASDGYLYIAIGDGGASNDVGNGHTPNIGNAQDVTNLLGKILRIDPLAPALTPGSTDPLSGNGRYRIPATNPFRTSGGGRDEIYAYGFRNPYRFSFDAASDRLIVGDVGQGAMEEVNVVQIGRNYGWNRKEGSFLFNPATGGISADPNPNPAFTNPVLEYDHGDGISVIGGFVYRGSAIPALTGQYVFGDFLRPGSGGRLFYGDLDARVMRELRLGVNPRAFGLRIKGFGNDNAGELYVLADNNTNTAGQVLKLVPIPATAGLLNISSRARVESDGQGFAIAGFIVTGSAPKSFIVRGVGPSLRVNGQPIPGRLANPALTLLDSNSTVVASNDDWMTHPRQQEIRDAGLAPDDPAEAAVMVTLAPGTYTAVMQGVSGAAGIGLVEVYDPASQLQVPANAVNLSTRARVRTGDNVLIGGMIVGGTGTQRVIARAIGPSLTSSGIAAPLPNPTLELVNASGVRIGFNDEWRSDQASEITATGLAPVNDAESAIIATLAAGNYTAIVRGASDTSGVGLVEFFRLNPQ
jgi:glucose/arabinose dehydrogenase